MPRQVKVYNDGGHYIGIPPKNFSGGKNKTRKPNTMPTNTTQEKFETAYLESQSLPKK